MYIYYDVCYSFYNVFAYDDSNKLRLFKEKKTYVILKPKNIYRQTKYDEYVVVFFLWRDGGEYVVKKNIFF